MKKGRLYGVSVGPGDPELMTLKAVRIASACPVVAVPRSSPEGEPVAYAIARQSVPGLEQKELLELRLPMTRDPGELAAAREKAAAEIARRLREGRDVAFLSIGDVSVYSTYTYVQKLVRAAGYPCEMVPGVPSFCAVAARLGEPLAEAGQPLHVIPASYAGVERALDWDGVKVLMKSGRAMERVRELLRRRGLLEKARLVQQCGMPGERVCRSLDGADGDAHYLSTVVVEE